MHHSAMARPYNLFLALLCWLAASSAAAQDVLAGRPDTLTFNGDVDSGISHSRSAKRYGMEYRLYSHSWIPLKSCHLSIVPMMGFAASFQGARYPYLGFRIPLVRTSRWLVTPGFAAGYYARGNDVDLKSSREFRSGLEVAIRLNRWLDTGLEYYHISNGNPDRSRNPGVEGLALVITFGTGAGPSVFGDRSGL
jgi:hypothetical protein